MSEELQNPDRDTKAQRNEHPSGWLVLTKNESVPYIIDALLDAPPHREFNQTELAELAGVSRQSVSRYLDLLVDVGIVEVLDGTSPQRYRFDPDGHVSEALIRLDGAMNGVGTELETSS